MLGLGRKDVACLPACSHTLRRRSVEILMDNEKTAQDTKKRHGRGKVLE